MYLSDRIRQLHKDYPLGSEPAIIRKRRRVAFVIHAMAIGYLAVALLMPALLFWVCWDPASILFVPTSLIFLASVFLVPGLLLGIYLDTSKADETIGVEFKRRQLPQVFELVDDASKGLNSSKVTSVWITGDLNAGARKYRGWRTFFRAKREIFLGVPLMHVSSVANLKCTLAHEVEHWNRVSLQPTWFARKAALASWRAPVFWLFRPIEKRLRELEHELRAIHHVLARRSEYFSDEASAKLCGPRQAVDSLISMYIHSESLAKFRPEYRPGYYLVSNSPPADLLLQDMQAIDKGGDVEKVQHRYREVMNSIASCFSRHPSLQRRVEHLGVEAPEEFELSPKPNSLDLLGDQSEEILNLVNQVIAKNREQWWRSNHDWLTALGSRIDLDCEPQTANEAWDRYYITMAKEGFEPAKMWLEKVVEFRPTEAKARFKLARGTLRYSDSETPDSAIEKATVELMDLLTSPNLVVATQAQEFLLPYLEATGQLDRLIQSERCCDEIEFRNQQLHLEKRASMGVYRPANIPEWQFNRLNEIFQAWPVITRVSVARKRLKACVSTRYLVFVVRFSQLTFFPDQVRNHIVPKIKEVIGSEEVDFHLIVKPNPFSRVGNLIEKMESTEIYRKQ